MSVLSFFNCYLTFHFALKPTFPSTSTLPLVPASSTFIPSPKPSCLHTPFNPHLHPLPHHYPHHSHSSSLSPTTIRLTLAICIAKPPRTHDRNNPIKVRKREKKKKRSGKNIKPKRAFAALSPHFGFPLSLWRTVQRAGGGGGPWTLPPKLAGPGRPSFVRGAWSVEEKRCLRARRRHALITTPGL